MTKTHAQGNDYTWKVGQHLSVIQEAVAHMDATIIGPILNQLTEHIIQEQMTTMAEERARSFIERYVIARASHFRVEHEQRDMHECVIMAKSAYRHIADVARYAEPAIAELDPYAALAGNAMQAVQALGAAKHAGVAGPSTGRFPPVEYPPGAARGHIADVAREYSASDWTGIPDKEVK